MDFKKKIVVTFIFLVFFIAMGFVSCGKKSDDVSKDTEIGDAEIETVSETDFSESDEDLLTVDYKEFYDELAPHGEWIEVTDKDIDLKMKKGSASGESSHRKISLSDFFGVKDAHAYDDVSFGAFFVWRPAPNLAVGLSVTEPEPTYVPYSNGQWLHTDAGWYFRAATPYEETVHHYGRWVYSPALGWLWVPGRVRSPAWVDWREDDSYIAWAPVPPSVYIVNNVVIVPPLYEERYIVVERRYFMEPYVYKHHHKGHKYRIHEWYRPEGVVVVNNMVQNHGPDIIKIQNTIGGTVNTVNIETVRNIKDVKYSDNRISVYSPQFKKVKTEKKLSSPFTKPGKYDSYGQYSGKKNDNGDMKYKEGSDNRGFDDKSNEKMNKGDDKNYDRGKQDKGKNYQDKGKQRIGDDSNMKDGGKNRQKNEDKGGKDRKNNDNNVKEKSRDNNDKGGKDKQKGNKKFRNEYKGNDNSKENNKGYKDNSSKNKKESRERKSDSRVKQKGNERQKQKDFNRDNGKNNKMESREQKSGRKSGDKMKDKSGQKQNDSRDGSDKQKNNTRQKRK